MGLEEKTAWRDRLRHSSRDRTPEERRTASLALVENLLASEVWERATQVLAFWPLPTEPDGRSLLDAAHASGKDFGLLKLGDQGLYEARVIQNAEKDLRSGAYGILEPDGGCPPLFLNPLDLILVPGVGFDAFGMRLGRGKGYYDRFLSTSPGLKIGFGFSWQCVREALPCELHDQSMDGVLNETGWFKTCNSHTSME